jgi:erythromycin esterase-like protein
MSRPCGSPTGTRLGVGMAELDLVRLRELAAELGYWAASTDEEHVARLRAQDARYDEQEDQDPGGDKWQKMMGAWVTQVKKSSVQERKDRP